MKIEDIQTVLVIGVGTMGQEIALQCALHGYDVIMVDLSSDALANAKSWQHDKLLEFVQEGRITLDAVSEVDNRIGATLNLEFAAREADLVSESVPEKLEVKRQTWERIGPLCPERTIFTTNSSFIAPSKIADASGRPERFAGLHFHKNVWHSNVADIMPHPGTSPEVPQLLVEFARRIDQIPIVTSNEQLGQVFNALFQPMMFSAIALAENEVASVEDVDRVWMKVMNAPIGPFGMMDMIGLEVLRDSGKYINQSHPDPQKERCIAFLEKLIDAGRSGVKSGQGFYKYPNPDFEQPEFLATALPTQSSDEAPPGQ